VRLINISSNFLCTHSVHQFSLTLNGCWFIYITSHAVIELVLLHQHQIVSSSYKHSVVV